MGLWAMDKAHKPSDNRVHYRMNLVSFLLSSDWCELDSDGAEVKALTDHYTAIPMWLLRK
jgi:hypothetical protein